MRKHRQIFVGSVFADSPRNSTWYALHQRYFARTLGGAFQHAVYLNRTSAADFGDSRIVGLDARGGPSGRAEHSRGLDALLHYFREHTEYEHGLLIDSDAFPFRDGWLDTLLAWMDTAREGGPKMFAAPVRTENLDTFPHPCAFFIKGEFARGAGAALSFAPAPHTNLVGHRFEDVGCGVSVWAGGSHVFLPLLRTNRWNPHPLLAAIYGDLFYHHGAGSRLYEGSTYVWPAHFRAEQTGYFARMITAAEDPDLELRLFDRLRADTDGLLAELTGR